MCLCVCVVGEGGGLGGSGFCGVGVVYSIFYDEHTINSVL